MQISNITILKFDAEVKIPYRFKYLGFQCARSHYGIFWTQKSSCWNFFCVCVRQIYGRGQQFYICSIHKNGPSTCSDVVRKNWFSAFEHIFSFCVRFFFNMAPMLFHPHYILQHELAFGEPASIHFQCVVCPLTLNADFMSYWIFCCCRSFFLRLELLSPKRVLNWRCHPKYGVQSITAICIKKRCHYLIHF